jgi:hypothetical protein
MAATLMYCAKEERAVIRFLRSKGTKTSEICTEKYTSGCKDSKEGGRVLMMHVLGGHQL